VGQRLQLTLGLDHGNNLTARKHADPAGKTSAFTPCAFGEPAHHSVVSTEHAHGLAGLGPVPLANTDGLIDDGRHRSIVSQRARAVLRT